jgi:hypothetical protein
MHRTPENYLILVMHKAWYLSNNCGAGGAAFTRKWLLHVATPVIEFL